MATIALRVPTVVAGKPNLPGGHCYIIFTEPTITVRELIAEKVRAELRKMRAGGPETSSIALLMPDGVAPGEGPLDEMMAITKAQRAFTQGNYILLYDGAPLVDLDETIPLTRRTGLVFLVADVEDTPVSPI